MWSYLIIIIASCVSLFWFCFTRKRDVVETHETNARIIGILAVCLLLCVWLIIYAFVPLSNHGASNGGFWALALKIPFTLPLILVLYSYFSLERSFKCRYHLEPLYFTKATDTEWPQLVNQMSKKLGLIRSPAVAMMPGGWRTPVVFGRSEKHAILALPLSLREMAESASGRKSQIADGLAQFILLHELAHIKNRDVVFASWLECFLRSFRYVAGLLILYLLLEDLLRPNNSGTRLTLVMLIVCYSSLLLLANSFGRYRELLADARASLCLNKDLLSELLMPKKNGGISPFESALVMCTVLSVFGPPSETDSKTNLLKIVARKLLQIFWVVPMFIQRAACVISVEPPRGIKLRVAALKTHKYVDTQSALPTFSAAFWNGLVGGLAFLFSILISIFLEAYAGRSASSWHFAKAVDIAGLWAGWGALFYVSYVYSLPLRNSTVIAIQASSYIKGLALRYCLGALAGLFLFALLTVVSSTAWNQPFAYLGAIVISSGFYTIAFLLSCIFSSLLRLEEAAALYRRKEALILFTLLPAGLCVLGVFAALAWWIGWFITLLGIAIGLPISLLFLATFSLQGHTVDRWVRIGFPIPVFRKLFDKWLFEKNTFLISNLSIFVIHVAPSSVATLVLTKLLGRGWVSKLGIPERQMLYLALLILLPVFCLGAYYIGKLPSRLLARTLRMGYLLSQSLRILGRKPLPEDSEKMQRILSFAESKHGGFLNVAGKLSVCMETTWTGLACLSALGLQPEYKAEHVTWILQCENEVGGFGVLPSLSSRLSATFYALSSLSTLGSLKAVDSEKHAIWIRKWQSQEGGFHGPYSDWEILTDTYFAVGSLQLLGKIESIDHKSYASWALNDWRRGSVTHERTYYLVNILVWLGQLSQERAAEIERKYLLPYAPVIAHLRIDKYPGLVFYYLSCTAALGDITSIERKTGQFTNRVQIAFRSFVRNSAEKLITDDFRR